MRRANLDVVVVERVFLVRNPDGRISERVDGEHARRAGRYDGLVQREPDILVAATSGLERIRVRRAFMPRQADLAGDRLHGRLDRYVLADSWDLERMATGGLTEELESGKEGKPPSAGEGQTLMEDNSAPMTVLPSFRARIVCCASFWLDCSTEKYSRGSVTAKTMFCTRARVEEKEGHTRRRIESIVYLGVVQATIVGIVDVDLQRICGVGDKVPGSGSGDDLLLVRFGVKPQTEL
jgi:hypothetical protein